MDAAEFLADLERKPETLAALADVLVETRPFAAVLEDIDEILFVGMGSSAYAAGVAAARLRSRGFDATAELAQLRPAAAAAPAPARRRGVRVRVIGRDPRSCRPVPRHRRWLP